ncbi:MAG: 2-phospho-L-lactate guanylyltransferase, partial [Deltaproteobacteria bacterium]|nr:2-phospho-L-lactate guanylyltransferase [Deltaproteobacteria bacterium]
RDIETIISLGKPEKSIVISPCRRGNGTNALFIKPPGIIEYCFGDKSFLRHQELAFQCGVVPAIYRSHGIEFDLDFPEDLQSFLRGEGLHETNKYNSYSKLSYN